MFYIDIAQMDDSPSFLPHPPPRIIIPDRIGDANIKWNQYNTSPIKHKPDPQSRTIKKRVRFHIPEKKK